MNLYKKYKIKEAAIITNNDTDEIREIMINDRTQELAESEAIRERILADATFNADVKRQSDLYTQIRA